MTRDQRDPSELGEKLLSEIAVRRARISRLVDDLPRRELIAGLASITADELTGPVPLFDDSRDGPMCGLPAEAIPTSGTGAEGAPR